MVYEAIPAMRNVANVGTNPKSGDCSVTREKGEINHLETNVLVLKIAKTARHSTFTTATEPTTLWLFYASDDSEVSSCGEAYADRLQVQWGYMVILHVHETNANFVPYCEQ